MPLEDRKSLSFVTPAAEVDVRSLNASKHAGMTAQMIQVMQVEYLEALAATQMGFVEKMMVVRNKNSFKSLFNPRLVDVSNENFVYLQVPRLHTAGDYIQRFPMSVTMEWELDNGSTERQNVYGVRGAVYQLALGYLEARPPWKYEPLGDW